MALEASDFTEYLKNPILFPHEFKDYLNDFFATNVPKLHVSQINGFKLQSFKLSDVATARISSFSATSYTSVATSPSFTGVPDGYYLAVFGAGVSVTGATADYGTTITLGKHLYMTPIVDGSTPDDGDAALIDSGYGGRITILDLTSSSVDNHTVEFRYKLTSGSNPVSIHKRWAYLIKVTTDDSTV